jgi:hypothetical protein
MEGELNPRASREKDAANREECGGVRWQGG